MPPNNALSELVRRNDIAGLERMRERQPNRFWKSVLYTSNQFHGVSEDTFHILFPSLEAFEARRIAYPHEKPRIRLITLQNPALFNVWADLGGAASFHDIVHIIHFQPIQEAVRRLARCRSMDHIFDVFYNPDQFQRLPNRLHLLYAALRARPRLSPAAWTNSLLLLRTLERHCQDFTTVAKEMQRILDHVHPLLAVAYSPDRLAWAQWYACEGARALPVDVRRLVGRYLFRDPRVVPAGYDTWNEIHRHNTKLLAIVERMKLDRIEWT